MVPENFEAFICISILLILVLILNGYIRLYCIAKMKTKKIIIWQICLFLIGEAILTYHFFFRI